MSQVFQRGFLFFVVTLSGILSSQTAYSPTRTLPDIQNEITTYLLTHSPSDVVAKLENEPAGHPLSVCGDVKKVNQYLQNVVGAHAHNPSAASSLTHCLKDFDSKIIKRRLEIEDQRKNLRNEEVKLADHAGLLAAATSDAEKARIDSIIGKLRNDLDQRKKELDSVEDELDDFSKAIKSEISEVEKLEKPPIDKNKINSFAQELQKKLETKNDRLKKIARGRALAPPTPDPHSSSSNHDLKKALETLQNAKIALKTKLEAHYSAQIDTMKQEVKDKEDSILHSSPPVVPSLSDINKHNNDAIQKPLEDFHTALKEAKKYQKILNGGAKDDVDQQKLAADLDEEIAESDNLDKSNQVAADQIQEDQKNIKKAIDVHNEAVKAGSVPPGKNFALDDPATGAKPISPAKNIQETLEDQKTKIQAAFSNLDKPLSSSDLKDVIGTKDNLDPDKYSVLQGALDKKEAAANSGGGGLLSSLTGGGGSQGCNVSGYLSAELKNSCERTNSTVQTGTLAVAGLQLAGSSGLLDFSSGQTTAANSSNGSAAALEAAAATAKQTAIIQSGITALSAATALYDYSRVRAQSDASAELANEENAKITQTPSGPDGDAQVLATGQYAKTFYQKEGINENTVFAQPDATATYDKRKGAIDSAVSGASEEQDAAKSSAEQGALMAGALTAYAGLSTASAWTNYAALKKQADALKNQKASNESAPALPEAPAFSGGSASSDPTLDTGTGSGGTPPAPSTGNQDAPVLPPGVNTDSSGAPDLTPTAPTPDNTPPGGGAGAGSGGGLDNASTSASNNPGGDAAGAQGQYLAGAGTSGYQAPNGAGFAAAAGKPKTGGSGDLSGLFDKFLPKKDDGKVNAGGLLSFSKPTDSWESDSLLSADANIFDRVHEAYGSAAKSKWVEP